MACGFRSSREHTDETELAGDDDDTDEAGVWRYETGERVETETEDWH